MNTPSTGQAIVSRSSASGRRPEPWRPGSAAYAPDRAGLVSARSTPTRSAPGPAITDDYEYHGLLADSWDLLRGDYSEWPDRTFWRAIIERQGGPALDVGCGTGRLLLDYLEAGLDVDGVDNSPEMLALCIQKAAAQGIDLGGRLYPQAMEALDLPRRYATIFIPSLSFQLVLDPAAADAALARFRDHLEPGGLLVASFSAKLWPGRRTPPQMEWSDWYMMAEQPRGDGSSIRRWIRAQYDHVEQVEHEENRFEVVRDGEVTHTEHHARSPCVRWYTLEQAMALFERAGFAAVNATAGDDFEPAAAGEIRFKVFGRVAG